MSKTPEQVENLCAENDKLAELRRLRDAIVHAAIEWRLGQGSLAGLFACIDAYKQAGGK